MAPEWESGQDKLSNAVSELKDASEIFRQIVADNLTLQNELKQAEEEIERLRIEKKETDGHHRREE